MPTETFPVGRPFAMVQNTVYAMPPGLYQIFSEGSPTIQQSNTLAFTANVAVTLTGGMSLIVAPFIRATSAGVTAEISRY